MQNDTFEVVVRNLARDPAKEFKGAAMHAIDPAVAITLLADRGFGDQKLYEYLDSLAGWWP